MTHVWSCQCNEDIPCNNCIRRGQTCRRLLVDREAAYIPPDPARPSFSSPASTKSDVNLLHLKLYHHFQTSTIQTLLLSAEVWEHALQLSFQFEFLANAIICVAARHLSFLQPEDTKYPTSAANHLCRALSQFRQELSKDFTSTHFDAFIATSLLLQYEIWTNTDDISPSEGPVTSSGLPRDSIFAFCSSLKKVFLKSVPLIASQPSVFMPYIRQDSRSVLVKAAKISTETLTAYQTFFSYYRPLDAELVNLTIPYTRGAGTPMLQLSQYTNLKTQEVSNPIEEGYAPIITQLCLILSFLPEANPREPVEIESLWFPDLVKHILSFPVICHGPFNSMIQQGDPHALLLLCHFYRAVRVLIPASECWWVHKRATLSEIALKEWLMDQITE